MPDGIVRIGDRATFEAFRTTDRRARRGPLVVAFVPAPPDDARVRVAFAIGRRVGTAVVRNRLRRRLRAVMRALRVDGTAPPGAYLLSASAGADALPAGELRAALAAAVTAASGVRR